MAMTIEKPIIALKDVEKRFGNFVALTGFNLDFETKASSFRCSVRRVAARPPCCG